ncbi:hypothetical protein JW707_02555 [Candidatus Woesearchaeota archaeon]|nr:hypothetical protein [Candidatus Woesearchaeota archaeon]
MIGWGIGILIITTVIMLLLRTFFKTAYRVITIIWFVMFLGGLAFGILIYYDTKEFTKGFSENDSLFLLESEGEIIAGFVMTPDQEEHGAVVINETIRQEFRNSDYDAMLRSGNFYKLMIFNETCFDNLDEIELGEDLNITKDTVFSIIKSEKSIDDYADWIISEKGYSPGVKFSIIQNLKEEGIEVDSQMKGFMFRLVYSQANIDDSAFLIRRYRERKVIIYEETLTFKMIKKFPEFLIKDLMQNV